MKTTGLLRSVLAFGLMLTLALGAVDAQAKRMGGGKSIGRQSNAVTQREAAPPQQAAPAATRQQAAATPPAKQPSRWGGILGGLAAGLGLAALFHALGFGGALASFLGSALMIGLLALAAFWIFSLLRRKSSAGKTAQSMQYANASSGGYAQAPLGVETQMPSQWSPQSAGTSSTGASSIPADFDREGFLSSAKQHYTRLQQAWDAADLNSLQTFTTPEMYEALAAELHQRGMTPNKTEVVTLEASLLALEETPAEYVASVEFSGLVREETWGGASPVREVWNLVKPRDGSSGWQLAGIQQLN
ncbi:Tim44 domain-containing protein [Thiomonas bhubaneswarensis]|uniref:Predicted lipid-binding transport protein, Tim44 family n=1 Tax=Thiomonas bhubaneswarensis TaxID=339866 RepID=A0A0K6HVJ7_9BURK|nr:Tim44-like domain-containing protein [Thiomonas bhubaneswarensis]CUA94934.1 Predicted lipid-binding transport protein, Tim44 family [Thiomonas bhubaneswarensis]